MLAFITCLLMSLLFSSAPQEAKSKFIDIGQPIEFQGRQYQHRTTQEMLDRHSSWDGRQEINIRLEQLYQKANTSYFSGIGGLVPKVEKIVLTKFDENHWYWVACVDIHRMYRDQGNSDLRNPKPLISIEIPFHLDGQPMGHSISELAVATTDSKMSRALAKIESVGGRISSARDPRTEEVKITQVSFQGNRDTTNVDLEPLLDVPNVLRIDLDFTMVDDLSTLENQTELYWLDLEDTNIDSDDLKRLEKLKKLSVLILSGTKVTDEGMEYLADKSRLRHLRLNDTKVTDETLEHLKKLNMLRELELKRTNVTLAGVQSLAEELPKCRISHDFEE